MHPSLLNDEPNALNDDGARKLARDEFRDRAARRDREGEFTPMKMSIACATLAIWL